MGWTMTGGEVGCAGEGIEMERKYGDAENKDGPGDKLVMWERSRVLLVEADYSTRQIITALLRKCSYRGCSSFFCFFDMFWLLHFVHCPSL